MQQLYKSLTLGQWSKLSLVEQMGNIGSEFARARNAQERNNIERRDHSLDRALELIDLTKSAHRDNQDYAHEVSILQDVVVDIRKGLGQYGCTLSELERYCLPFALLARKNV